MGILDQLSISRKQAHSIATSNGDASRSQINLWHGAVRSGKTIGSLVKFEMKLADAPTVGENVLISRTRDTAYRNVIAPLMDPGLFGGLANHVHYNRGAPTANILGETVHVIGASDVRAENVIRGMTIKRSYCDEMTLMAEEFVNQLVARHSVPGAWMGGTTNPDGPRHFLKRDYIDRADEMGHRIFHFNLEDNRAHLPEGYIESLDRQYTGLWNDRFIKGLWTMADGVIYDMFDPALHVVDRLPDMQQLLAMGLDDGFNHPAAGILLGLGDDNRLYAIAEFDPGKGTPADRARLLRRFENEHGQPPYHFVDPSAAQLKEQLNREAFPGVANASNNHRLGIGMVASLFATQQLRIHSSCTNLLNEIPGYVWDSKAVERGEDKPVKENDDFCFVPGTLVETQFGPRRIELVDAGDYVHTREGLRRVKAAGMTSESAAVYTVHMSDGSTLTGTGGHPVWVDGKGWTRLDALRYADRLEAWKNVSRQSFSRGSSSAATRTLNTSRAVDTSSPASRTSSEGFARFTKRCGWTRMAWTTSLLDSMSTIATTTRATIVRATSSWSNGRSTSDTTATNRARKSRWSTGSAFVRQLLHGTDLKLASLGIASMASGHGKVASIVPSSASSVAASTTRELRNGTTGSARTPANLRGVERQASMMSTETARSAGDRSASISTASSGSAPVRVVRVVAEAQRSPVYNLTVEDVPEYFAGGVLVHNCDALRYAVASSQFLWRYAVPLPDDHRFDSEDIAA